MHAPTARDRQRADGYGRQPTRMRLRDEVEQPAFRMRSTRETARNCLERKLAGGKDLGTLLKNRFLFEMLHCHSQPFAGRQSAKMLV